MARKSGKSGGDEDPEGPSLWKAYTNDIAPMRGKKSRKAVTVPEKILPKKTAVRTASALPIVPPVAIPEKQAPQLDARTDQRLRRGQVPIDGKLDLHGMIQAEAHERLNDFIKRAYAKKKRCLLIITGKGKKGEGVLRQKLPQWLSVPPIKDVILKIYPAAAEHGGTGAWYVYLKRQRDY